MSIKAIIIDDEYNSMNNLKLLVEQYCPKVEIVDLAENAEEGRKKVEEHNPDLVFLDVEMPKENGFQFLESLPSCNFQVIFVTAYNEFANEAFKVNAIDYIEKPVDIEFLKKAVQKVVREVQMSKQNNGQAFKTNVDKVQDIRLKERIGMVTKDGYILFKESDVTNLESNENYTIVYLENGKRYVSTKSIKVYEKFLSKDVFFRVHKSHIVNVKHHMVEFSRSKGNVVILSNGKMIPVSRRRLSMFLHFINVRN